MPPEATSEFSEFRENDVVEVSWERDDGTVASIDQNVTKVTDERIEFEGMATIQYVESGTLYENDKRFDEKPTQLKATGVTVTKTGEI